MAQNSYTANGGGKTSPGTAINDKPTGAPNNPSSCSITMKSDGTCTINTGSSPLSST